jgi:hypothetical protein
MKVIANQALHLLVQGEAKQSCFKAIDKTKIASSTRQRRDSSQ